VVKAVILDPWLTERLMAERRAKGLDRWDEVWGGVCHMAPAPNLEHQRIERELLVIFHEAVIRVGIGEVFHEVNVANPEGGMEDFRIPDLVVLLPESYDKMQGMFIAGGPDFIMEIHSPGDETYEKLPWYSEQGVREALIIDRDTKALSLYRRQGDQLVEVTSASTGVESQLLPLRFEVVEEDGIRRLYISHLEESPRNWRI
jgi:Uma2 family endonuclease